MLQGSDILYCVLQRIFEIEGWPVPPEIILVDEAGFNLTKRRRRGRNIIGHRAIVNVPGQRGGNVTMCAAISQRGVLHRHASLGPYNTMLLSSNCMVRLQTCHAI